MTSEQQHSPSPSAQAHGDLTPLEISIREALLSEAIAPPAGLEARVMRSVAPRASMPFNGRVMGMVAAGVLLLGVGLLCVLAMWLSVLLCVSWWYGRGRWWRRVG